MATPASPSPASGISVSFRVCLKLFLENFYILFFAYISYIPKVLLKETLMFFTGCFDSEEMRFYFFC